MLSLTPAIRSLAKGLPIRHEKCCLVDHGVVPFRSRYAVFRGMSPLYTKWDLSANAKQQAGATGSGLHGNKTIRPDPSPWEAQGDGRNVGDQQQQDDLYLPCWMIYNKINNKSAIGGMEK